VAITVVGTPTNTGDAAGNSSTAVTVPTGAASGDIAVVYLGQWGGSGGGATPTITPASGFAQKGGFFTSGDGLAKNSIWWKRLTGSDSGTYSFSYTGDGSFFTTCQCVMFRGGATSGDPWETVATPLTGTWGSCSTISVTTTDPNGALFWAVYNDSAGTHTPPTNFTEAADNDSASCAYRIPGSAGTLSAASASISSSSAAGEWLGALLSDTPVGLPNNALQAAGPWPCF